MNKSKKTRKTSPDQRSSKPARSAGTGSGSKDIKILETAKEKAKQLVQKNPSAANLTAYERASKMVAQALTTAAPAGDETSFKNRMDALRYLQERGLKVKQSKFYRDCDLGLCRVEKNGVVTKASIENYIQHPQSNLESGKDNEDNELLKERARVSLDREKSQTELMQLRAKKEKGLYIEKALFEKELAARATVLKSDIDGFIRAQAGKIVELVAGDQTTIPKLIEFMTEQAAEWLHRYSMDGEIFKA